MKLHLSMRRRRDAGLPGDRRAWRDADGSVRQHVRVMRQAQRGWSVTGCTKRLNRAIRQVNISYIHASLVGSVAVDEAAQVLAVHVVLHVEAVRCIVVRILERFLE